jgi:hypothetical protein
MTVTIPTWFLYVAIAYWTVSIVLDVLLLVAKRRASTSQEKTSNG